MPARVTLATVQSEPLDVAHVQALTADDAAGALVTFAGIVRNHDHGRAVVEIEYVSHPSAAQVITEVAAEFRERPGVHAISVVHRVGTLGVGELALIAVVAASHRAEAFSTASDLVDRVKEKLPVWKRQLFTDGTDEWTGCP